MFYFFSPCLCIGKKKNVHHTHLKSNGYPSKWIILSHVYVLKKTYSNGMKARTRNHYLFIFIFFENGQKLSWLKFARFPSFLKGMGSGTCTTGKTKTFFNGQIRKAESFSKSSNNQANSQALFIPSNKPPCLWRPTSERQSLFPSQAIIRQIVKHSSSQVTSLLVFGDPLQFLFS